MIAPIPIFGVICVKVKIRGDVSKVSSPMAAVVAQRDIKDEKKLIDRKEIQR